MRKIQKEQLLELMDTLMEAHRELAGQPQDTVMNLLADCQECAMAIGSAIEESEGEDAPAVSFLVRYCELIYQLSLQAENRQTWEQIDSEAGSLLKETERSIQKDIPLKLEIVFLPYKASMWDCLESIWLAAREDERCDCYVIPIPYFDRNREGRADTMHYEGEQFPSYVPVTDYTAYSIQDRCPDVIYIHNPFDQGNYVTTVHPAYYSSELKKHTDMLVYVPYFITFGGMPESHLGLLGYQYADQIILQNEKARINMKKYTPEGKLSVLGSPKIDRTVSLDRNKPEMPSEWREFIRERKIFFYNTSISDLLKNREKELAKIEDVFTAFLAHKEVVLIWRPHPLTRSTLQSMCPELLQEYDRLEEWFNRERIGILDKTPDVNAVIAWSDAYIGDRGSSLVPLFGMTGKAVMVCPQATLEELASADFRRIWMEGEEIWFIAAGYSTVCKLDMRSGETKVICTIPESCWEDCAYMEVFKYGNKLIARTVRNNSLWEYDLQTGQYKKYYFKNKESEEPITFSMAFPYQQYIFFLPLEYGAIIRFNTEEGEFTYYDDCILDMHRVMGEPADAETKPFGWGASVKENQLYLTSALTNHILTFDMGTGDYRINRIGKDRAVYAAIVAGEKYNWLFRANDLTVIRWERGSDETREYNRFPEGYERGERPCCFVEEYGESLLLLPQQANMGIKVNIHTGRMEGFSFQMPYQEGEHRSEYYKHQEIYRCARKISDDKMICFTTYDNSLLLVNVTDGTYRKFPVRLDREYVLNSICSGMRGAFYKSNAYTYLYPEQENHLLEWFIEYVKSGRHDKGHQLKIYREMAENMDGSSGIKIHNYIMGRIL